MKVSCNEGVASHVGPKSCGDDRKVVVEALTGESAGRVLSLENVILWDADAVLPCGRQQRSFLVCRNDRCCLPHDRTASASQRVTFSRLNTRPALSPVNASTTTLRSSPHDSGPTWLATPSLHETFIHCTSPALPAHPVPFSAFGVLLRYDASHMKDEYG